jgi:hypothetical protein
MGQVFVDQVSFYVEQCCNCGIPFAMTMELQKRRRNDRQSFYCPNGHGQHYTGPTEAERLKTELERKNLMLDAAQAKAATAEQDRAQIAKAHQRMRTRVMNGVCPCCNRTFQNLMQHMRSEHPDFSATKTLFTLRQAFGMTQAALAWASRAEALKRWRVTKKVLRSPVVVLQ